MTFRKRLPAFGQVKNLNSGHYLHTLLMDENYSWFTDITWVLIHWTQGCCVRMEIECRPRHGAEVIAGNWSCCFLFVSFKALCLFQIWKSNEQWKIASFVCLFFFLTSKECYLRMRFMNTASKSFHQRALTRNMTGARITLNPDK